MPVFLPSASNNINIKSLQEFDYTEIKSNSALNATAANFFTDQVELLGPKRCLYIGQREFACVKFSDTKIDLIGSDDATTCHIVLLVDPTNKNCSLCHFDGLDMETGLHEIVSSLKALNSENHTFDLYIIGGFIDPRNISQKVTAELFKLFIDSDDEFHLKLCVVTELNDTIRNGIHYPNAYGLGYNIKTSSAFKCNKFLEKGPDLAVRSARHFSENGNMNIFNTQSSKLVIGPFDYDPIQYVNRLIQLPDSVLLEYFSTSPEQEPEDFVINLKKTFRCMIEHPKPCLTYFIDSKPFVYSKQEDGSWSLDI